MSLFKTYSNRSISQLVAIVESGDDYTNEARQVASTILELKEIDKETLKQEASLFWEQKLQENIKQLILNNKKPKSTILSSEEIAVLFRTAFENWKEKQKTFEIDTTKYWFV